MTYHRSTLLLLIHGWLAFSIQRPTDKHAMLYKTLSGLVPEIVWTVVKKGSSSFSFAKRPARSRYGRIFATFQLKTILAFYEDNTEV